MQPFIDNLMSLQCSKMLNSKGDMYCNSILCTVFSCGHMTMVRIVK